ncbi:MAG: ABC transporter ATP-binding protein [Planctomycetota bacterium]
MHRWFGPTHAVRGVSFSVEPGEVFGYIGPNGAGKTTSMRILATLQEASAGDAFVDGFSVSEDPDRVRARLGFMPDYFGAYQDMNVREYLDFFARAYGLRGEERRRAIAHTMDFTRLEPLADKPIDGLSKGMKQRLCLGRTMIHDPSVMVLDEPAAGLDPRARIELREMIAQLAEAGKAVLISSHILTELAEFCDRVAIIEHGSIVAAGTVEQISSRVEETVTVEARIAPGGGATRDAAAPPRDAAALAEWLGRDEHASDVERVRDLVRFRYGVPPERRDAALADLLAALVGEGFRVAAFGARARSLEDVFLHVTGREDRP